MSQATKNVMAVAQALIEMADTIQKHSFFLTRSREDKARMRGYRKLADILTDAALGAVAEETKLLDQLDTLRKQLWQTEQRLDDVQAVPKVAKKPRIPWYRSPGGGIKGWLPTEEVKQDSPAYKQLVEIHQLNQEWDKHA